jgi:hypothetical protein
MNLYPQIAAADLFANFRSMLRDESLYPARSTSRVCSGEFTIVTGETSNTFSSVDRFFPLFDQLYGITASDAHISHPSWTLDLQSLPARIPDDRYDPPRWRTINCPWSHRLRESILASFNGSQFQVRSQRRFGFLQYCTHTHGGVVGPQLRRPDASRWWYSRPGKLADYGEQRRQRMKLLNCPSRSRKRLRRVFKNLLHNMRYHWNWWSINYSFL